MQFICCCDPANRMDNNIMLRADGIAWGAVRGQRVEAPPAAHQGHEGVGKNGAQRGDRQRHDHRQVRPGPLHLPGSCTPYWGTDLNEKSGLCNMICLRPVLTYALTERPRQLRYPFAFMKTIQRTVDHKASHSITAQPWASCNHATKLPSACYAAGRPSGDVTGTCLGAPDMNFCGESCGESCLRREAAFHAHDAADRTN